jgi:hypothetical protein
MPRDDWIRARTYTARLLRSAEWPGSIVLFGVLPVLVLIALFAESSVLDAAGKDFRGFYAAAESMLHRETPYISASDPNVNGAYVYPPLTAIGVMPFTLIPVHAAEYLAMAILVCGLWATVFVLGVRDWRCYGIAILWPPAIEAVQTGTVTIVLAFGAALAWRFRDRWLSGSLATAMTIALKLILWPLFVWLVATRRVASAVLSYIIALSLALGSWSIIGFAGLRQYPGLLQRLEDAVAHDSYNVRVLALDVGVAPVPARAAWLAVGISLLAGVMLVGRRGDDRTAFVLAIAAALALSPIVWLHYFTLLLVVVAIAQPRLGSAWLAPLVMWVATGSGHPTLFQTSATLLAASLTIALSVLAIRSSVLVRGRSLVPEGAQLSRSP